MGTLVALGIIAALAVWLIMKNKRSKVAPSSAFVDTYPKYEQSPPSPGLGPSQTYNLSNPFTFSPTLHDPSFSATTGYPQTTYDPHAQTRGQYTGVPEV